ncbi:MAG TPA: thiamine pyrophosphate-requiring protein [Alphaproteobacteria bacterium]|nr:thiamine pyrophosphate-requiring protein [Alphaproteobacteria bacterium]
MNLAEAAAEILKREGVDTLLAYPLNPLIDAAAAADIRTIIVRQERVGVHMADAISRLTSGDRVGVFCMQAGPGTENAFGAVAQAYSEAVPLVVIPGGSARGTTWVKPAFNAALNFQHVTKHCEQVTTADDIVPALRRAFSLARNGRPGPVLVEIPGDMWTEELTRPVEYKASKRALTAPDAAAIDAAAAALLLAERPLIYAGQGVHYARAWDELRRVAELLEAPVTTSLEGKSAFPENHLLSLGSGGVAMPGQVFQHVQDADVVFGAGASFSATPFGIQFPIDNKVFIHNTVDPADINKNIPTEYPLVGDSRLALGMLAEALSDRLSGKPRGRAGKVSAKIVAQRQEWLKDWTPRLVSDDTPLSPYRVISELMRTVDVANTIITHDAGSPRDELSPFWQATAPLTYIGWGKSTQLGYGLGLAMGAKLAEPEKLCINVWGDAAIGMTGMDFETAARCNIPILSILFNNFAMAMEFPVMGVSREKFQATDISGNYADFARALGGYGERVMSPAEIVPAIKRGIEATQDGKPALLEFITTQEKIYSTFKHGYH